MVICVFDVDRCLRQRDGDVNVDLKKMLNNSLAPLAARMRPARLDDLVGQEHLVGSRGIIRQAIASGNIPSMILWGGNWRRQNDYRQHYCK